MTDRENPSLLHRTMRRLPVVGYALRCADEERPTELLVFALNTIMTLAVAGVIFGYAGFITVLLALTIVTALTIFSATLAR